LRYFIELSYNGKNYHGWQIQPNEISIQETIEKAMSLLLNINISVIGCGRTDTGVHASQFYLHFDYDHPIDKEKLKFMLNSFLPEDIAIFQIISVVDDAHARFQALSRSYQYNIYLGKNVFQKDLSLKVSHKNLDVDLIERETVTNIQAETLQLLQKLGKCGYIFSSGNTITTGARTNNVRTVSRTIAEQ